MSVNILQKITLQSSKIVFQNLSETESSQWKNAEALQLSRHNIERLLQEVVQDKNAKFQPNLRTNPEHRLAIQLSNEQRIPNLQSLSDGQSQLFHLFATIIRYGEHIDINKSIRLRDIKGLVVIDEIDANLHPTLQHDVLPRLIKMFPKFSLSYHPIHRYLYLAWKRDLGR